MPIGGGTFTVQNKILPGAYINFVSMGTNAKMGSRGVAALPLELNWGPDDKVFTMTATDFNATSLKVFGYDPMVVENDDQESSAGKQTVLLMDCNLDSVVLAKLDGDSDDALDEDADFTFEDFDILTPFTKF